MLYSLLETTTERGAVCRPCQEYKGMVDCLECEATFCIYCNDCCPECGESITFGRYE